MKVRASASVCGVDKNTSFRWRHRFLALPATVKASQGIVRGRRDVLPNSCKGQRQLDRPPRQRGKRIHTLGAGEDQVPVPVVRDHPWATADFKLEGTDTMAIFFCADI